MKSTYLRHPAEHHDSWTNRHSSFISIQNLSPPPSLSPSRSLSCSLSLMEMNVCSLLYNNTCSHIISPNLTSIHNENLFKSSLNYKNHRQLLHTTIKSVSKFEADVTETQTKPSVNPSYTPTPTNRHLRTPHSGYSCSFICSVNLRIYLCTTIYFVNSAYFFF